MVHKPYVNISAKKERGSRVIISGTLESSIFEGYKNKAVESFQKSLSLPGFRKGHIPRSMVEKHVGEIAILEDATERALRDAYPLLIEEFELSPIGKPVVRLTKTVSGEPVEFSIETAVLPEFTLPDYKALSEKIVKKEKRDPSITDEELNSFIERVRAEYAKHSGNTHKDSSGAKEKEPVLPDVTNEWVGSLGAFKNVNDFKDKMRKNLLEEKQIKERERLRILIGDALLENTPIDLPDILADYELKKMLAQFKDDIARSGTTYEDYLAHVKKTEEDLKKEWRATSEKRAKLQLILNKIAKEEHIEPDHKRVAREMAHISEHFENIDLDNLKIYVESVERNEAVFEMLEKTSKQ